MGLIFYEFLNLVCLILTNWLPFMIFRCKKIKLRSIVKYEINLSLGPKLRAPLDVLLAPWLPYAFWCKKNKMAKTGLRVDIYSLMCKKTKKDGNLGKHQVIRRDGHHNRCWVNIWLLCEEKKIASSYWLRSLLGELAPNVGVLRIVRSALMETSEDSNQHVFKPSPR